MGLIILVESQVSHKIVSCHERWIFFLSLDTYLNINNNNNNNNNTKQYQAPFLAAIFWGYLTATYWSILWCPLFVTCLLSVSSSKVYADVNFFIV